jgi:hypothetical protein
MCQNVAELTGGKLVWHRHAEIYSPFLNSGGDYAEKYLKFERIFCIKHFFLIAYFVNSSPDDSSE